MKLWVIALAAIQVSVTANKCPENVSCKSTLDRNSCPSGTYFRENSKSMGCCPACVKLKGKGENCIKAEECAPGFTCKNGKCFDDNFQSCEYYKNTDKIWTTNQYWQPNCLPNGKYAPKQCKGEKLTGKCFCTNENGNRIFGEMEWLKADNMTCACSRLVEDLIKTKKDLSLHCDEDGNFEELQCVDNLCWCSNERTGIPYTPVVPLEMKRILPCFYNEAIGSQYLRKCESSMVNSVKVKKLLFDHGTTTVLLPSVNCNHDGSYARIHQEGELKYCVYKNNEKLTETSGFTCNCAYDEFVAKNIKKQEFHFECEPTGDYKTEQFIADQKFNVDPDGFPYSICKKQE